MASPSFDEAKSAADYAAITCPIERAAAITRESRRLGTLPGTLHRLRVAALNQARGLIDPATGEPYRVEALAELIGISHPRISQLTGKE